MLRRWGIVVGTIALGLVLNGCTKCGPIWDDWMPPPKSCKSDHL
ncbi:peptidylprolyl isomerase [Bradyrhizobium sp.]